MDLIEKLQDVAFDATIEKNIRQDEKQIIEASMLLVDRKKNLEVYEKLQENLEESKRKLKGAMYLLREVEEMARKEFLAEEDEYITFNIQLREFERWKLPEVEDIEEEEIIEEIEGYIEEEEIIEELE